jgi:hypothetical protein
LGHDLDVTRILKKLMNLECKLLYFKQDNKYNFVESNDLDVKRIIEIPKSLSISNLEDEANLYKYK